MNWRDASNDVRDVEGSGSGRVALRFAERGPASVVDGSEGQVAGVVGPGPDAGDGGDGPEKKGTR